MPRHSRIVLQQLADLTARDNTLGAKQIGWAESVDVVDRLSLAGFHFSNNTQKQSDELVRRLFEIVDSAELKIDFDLFNSKGAPLDTKSLNITRYKAQKLSKHLTRFLIMQSFGRAIVSPINSFYEGDQEARDYSEACRRSASCVNSTKPTSAIYAPNDRPLDSGADIAFLVEDSEKNQGIREPITTSQAVIAENVAMQSSHSIADECIAAWDPIVARSLLAKGWHQSEIDGLFRLKTQAERSERIDHDVSVFFGAYDHIDALAVANPIPADCRGYAGPGQTLSRLAALCASVRSSKRYFLPNNFGDARRYEFDEIFDQAPCILQWRDDEESLAVLESSDRRLLAHGGGAPDTHRRKAVVSNANFCYDEAALSIARNSKSMRPPYILSLTKNATQSLVVAGPGGCGKTHQIDDFITQNARNTQLNIFLLNGFDPEKNRETKLVFSLAKFNDLVETVRSLKTSGLWNILVVDEYAEITNFHLSCLGDFHQVIFFGDYAQSACVYMPVFDFVVKCEGAFVHNTYVWRANQERLFDLVSALAYDSLYVAYPTPLQSRDGGDNAIVASSCLDDPTAEVLAMFVAAKRNLEIGLTVSIVIDDDLPDTAQSALARCTSGGGLSNFCIIPLSELRGNESNIVIVATGMLDRKQLSISQLCAYLIVILGRAKNQVQFILPQSTVVGSEKRRFSCLVQPIISYRANRRNPDSPLRSLAYCLSKKNVDVRIVHDCLAVHNRKGENFMLTFNQNINFYKILVYKF